MPQLSFLKRGKKSSATESDAKIFSPRKSATHVLSEQEIANRMLHIMLRNNNTPALRHKIAAQLPVGGWTEAIARCLFDSLVRQLNPGAGVMLVLEKAMQKAHDAAEAGMINRYYPNLISAGTSVTALGMLTIVMPEAIKALGFEIAEPTIDSFAAVWQRTYSNVPYRIFYRYLHGLESGSS